MNIKSTELYKIQTEFSVRSSTSTMKRMYIFRSLRWFGLSSKPLLTIQFDRQHALLIMTSDPHYSGIWEAIRAMKYCGIHILRTSIQKCWSVIIKLDQHWSGLVNWFHPHWTEARDLPMKWLTRLFKMGHFSEFSLLYCVFFVFYPIVFHNRSDSVLVQKITDSNEYIFSFFPSNALFTYSKYRKLYASFFFLNSVFSPNPLNSLKNANINYHLYRSCLCFWMDSEITKGKRENRCVYFQSVDFFRIECLRLKGNPI